MTKEDEILVELRRIGKLLAEFSFDVPYKAAAFALKERGISTREASAIARAAATEVIAESGAGKAFVSRRQAAGRYGVRLRKWEEDKLVAPIRKGGYYYYQTVDLERLAALDENTAAAAPKSIKRLKDV